MRSSLRELAQASLLAAVVVALGLVPPIRLPVSPVPITLQTLGVMLAGCLLPRRVALLSLLIFLLLLAAGFPVLAGGRGGPGYLLGPSGGYILSWPLAAYLIARWTEGRSPSLARLLLANLAGGILLVYACGVPVLALVTGMDVRRALVAGAAVFVPGDLLKAVAAALLAREVHRRYPALRAQAQAPGASLG